MYKHSGSSRYIQHQDSGKVDGFFTCKDEVREKIPLFSACDGRHSISLVRSHERCRMCTSLSLSSGTTNTTSLWMGSIRESLSQRISRQASPPSQVLI